MNLLLAVLFEARAGGEVGIPLSSLCFHGENLEGGPRKGARHTTGDPAWRCEQAPSFTNSAACGGWQDRGSGKGVSMSPPAARATGSRRPAVPVPSGL